MEKELLADEFIVTKTDPKGIITYANAAFLRMVAAKESELLARPHNVIRHPDMPRCVFRYFWREIAAGREIFAFVKNATLDHKDHYWVFANTTPSYDSAGKLLGYYSVRRRISEGAKAIIAPLYAQMLAAEKSGGMDAGWAVLQRVLDEKNLSYEQLILSLQGAK